MGDGINIIIRAARPKPRPRIAEGKQGAVPLDHRMGMRTAISLHRSQDAPTALPGLQRVISQTGMLRVVREGLDLLIVQREEIHHLTISHSQRDEKDGE